VKNIDVKVKPKEEKNIELMMEVEAGFPF